MVKKFTLFSKAPPKYPTFVQAVHIILLLCPDKRHPSNGKKNLYFLAVVFGFHYLCRLL